jgi:preprotein translocase subunit SecA
MDELRRSVQNASIEQKDPLLIYKLESFNLFKAMIERMNGDIVGFLSKAGLPSGTAPGAGGTCPPRAAATRGDQPYGGTAIQLGPVPAPLAPQLELPLPVADRCHRPAGPARPPATPVRVDKAPGRNDPCPCGSGKKYKQCHGQGA